MVCTLDGAVGPFPLGPSLWLLSVGCAAARGRAPGVSHRAVSLAGLQSHPVLGRDNTLTKLYCLPEEGLILAETS